MGLLADNRGVDRLLHKEDIETAQKCRDTLSSFMGPLETRLRRAFRISLN